MPENQPESVAAQMLERLLDLAHDVSSYLRHHHQSTVRTAAALLLAASLAACDSSPDVPESQDEVIPLTEEVRNNLPAQPGRYQVRTETLRRDSQGIYFFEWLQSGGPWNPASASLVQLAPSESNELEVPATGDPVLHLREDTPIALADTPVDMSATTPTPTSGSTSSSSSHSRNHVAWFPFPIGSTSTDRSPSYRNPPATTSDDGTTARGSSASRTPPPASQRTSGLPHAVSGQSRGTGSGTAASGKSGATSGGVGGQSGGSGSGDAASGKGSSAAGGGAGSARSGGFSGGGSSGGSSGGGSSS